MVILLLMPSNHWFVTDDSDLKSGDSDIVESVGVFIGMVFISSSDRSGSISNITTVKVLNRW